MRKALVIVCTLIVPVATRQAAGHSYAGDQSPALSAFYDVLPPDRPNVGVTGFLVRPNGQWFSSVSAPPLAVVAQEGDTAFDIVQTKWRAQADIVRAAYLARAAHDDTETIRLWRQIDAEPEVDVAFAGLPLPATEPSRYPPNAENLTAGREVDYARNLAFARAWIGRYYQGGVGVHQDYAEAARWYLKAMKTKVIEPTLAQALSEKSLAVLYAYGLGVPRNLGKARQLSSKYTSSDSSMAMFVRLLDENALPKTYNNDRFWQVVKTVAAKLDEGIARKQAQQADAALKAAKASVRPSEQTSSARPSTEDSGNPYGKALCNSAFGTSSFNFMSPCNW